MDAIWMPVDGSTGFFVGIDTDFGGLGNAIVPCLHNATISAKGEFDTVFGWPRYISYAVTLSQELLAAVAHHHFRSGVPEVPKPDCGILASRQEHATQEGTYRKTMHLTMVFMKPGNFDSGTIEVVKDNLAVRRSSRDVVAELAMRPLDVMNV
jgi:hypothetical protein